MADDLEVRPIAAARETRAAAALIDWVWGGGRIITPELLRALATHGNPVIAAFREGEMVGAQVGFLAREGDRMFLHSHATGVLPELQHTGVGFRLKQAQRDWCLAHGLDTVTWTFDPLIARNAYFNLRKLGSVADRFLRDFYGPMPDAFNVGERTDRLEVRWDLRSPRVAAAAEGRRGPPEAAGARPLLGEDDGQPAPRPGVESPRLLVHVPPDYLSLRRKDPSLAAAWRDAVAAALDEALGRGYVATDFLREGAYVLERSTGPPRP